MLTLALSFVLLNLLKIAYSCEVGVNSVEKVDEMSLLIQFCFCNF